MDGFAKVRTLKFPSATRRYFMAAKNMEDYKRIFIIPQKVEYTEGVSDLYKFTQGLLTLRGEGELV